MPVYEYVCQTCSNAFEELVRANERVACPECTSPKVEKRFSTFATSSEQNSRMSAQSSDIPGCGTCGDPRGPGACAM
jgi:putative FmdB family regulatory protein